MKPTPAQIALASLCGALALSIAWEVYAPLPSFAVPEIAVRDRPTQNTPQPMFMIPPQGAFDAINDRPIFSQSRKSIAPAPIGPAAAPPPPPSVALIGVILDAQNRLALVKTPSSPLEVSVGVGGSIGGWQVAQIAPDRIVLRLGTAEDEIKLEANRAKDETQNNTGPNSAASGPAPAVMPAVQPPIGWPMPAGTQTIGPAGIAQGNPRMLPQNLNAVPQNGTDKHD